MPLFSAFTPFGHFAFSGKQPPAKSIYDAIAKALGAPANFSLDIGSRSEALIYADAIGLARVFLANEKMRNQLDPLKATDMLPVYEAAYGLIPGPSDIISVRQRALAAAMLAPAGASEAAIIAALTAALGDDFVAYRTTHDDEVVNFPADPSVANGPGKWTDVTAAPIILRTAAVAIAGIPVSVSYSAIVGNPAHLFVGQTIVLSVNNLGLTERVTISAVAPGSFTTTTTKAHDTNDIATTGYFPFQASTKKHSLVILTAAACNDPQKVRVANQIMKRMATGVSTWAVGRKNDSTHAGGFIVDDPVRGRVDSRNVIDTVTYP